MVAGWRRVMKVQRGQKRELTRRMERTMGNIRLQDGRNVLFCFCLTVHNSLCEDEESKSLSQSRAEVQQWRCSK